MKRLMIVDDDEETLQALTSYLGDTCSIASFTSGDAAVAAASREIFPVILLDLHMAGMPGIEALKRLKELCAYQQVIIVTGHASAASAMTAVNLHAFHYLTKPYSFPFLRHLIALAYERYGEESLHVPSPTPRRFELLGLSSREADVTRAILRRKTSQEIAEKLGISQRTVEKHTERIFSRFGISSRFDLAEKIREAFQKLPNSSDPDAGARRKPSTELD